MTISLILFFAGISCIFVFAIYKVPDVTKISGRISYKKNPILHAQKTIKETGDDFQNRWNNLLENFLAFFRKIILKTERFVSKELSKIKKKNKNGKQD